jgi:glycosyltransferase involved in cell wall biosynthesis
MKKKRVLLFYSGAVYGGIDVLLKNLAPRFYDEYEVVLAFANQEHISSTIFRGETAPAIYKIPFKKWNFLFGLARLAAIVRREKIDILFTQEIPLSVAARSLKLIYPRLIHITTICSNFRAFTATNAAWTISALLFINRKTQSLVDKYISISAYLASYLTAEGISPSKIEVIHLGTDVPLAKSEASPHAAWVVAYIGRHSYEKGTDIFCAIAEAYLRTQQTGNVEFHLFGEGGFAEDKAAALKAEFPAFFITHGFVKDLTEYPIDCLVAPSRDEGFSFVMLEAFFRGIPLIASDQGAFPEIIGRDELGLICSNRDLSTYLAAIDKVKDDRALRHRLTETAGQAARQRYTKAVMQDKYIGLFNKIIREHSR